MSKYIVKWSKTVINRIWGKRSEVFDKAFEYCNGEGLLCYGLLAVWQGAGHLGVFLVLVSLKPKI